MKSSSRFAAGKLIKVKGVGIGTLLPFNRGGWYWPYLPLGPTNLKTFKPYGLRYPDWGQSQGPPIGIIWDYSDIENPTMGDILAYSKRGKQFVRS